MTDTITLPRKLAQKALNDLLAYWEPNATTEALKAALAAPQPEPQPVKQADHSELIIRLRKTHWSQTTAVNLMRDAADALEGAKQ